MECELATPNITSTYLPNSLINGCAALYTFSSFSTPEGKRHTKEANHPAPSENTPMYPLKQSEHTRHASFLLRFDSHATHACTLQPAALVFVSYGFVLV